MENTLAKYLMVCISVVLLGTLISFIAFTVVQGYAITNGIENRVINEYSEAGLSMIIDAQNTKDVDGANLYKIMDANRNLITSFDIVLLDGTKVMDIRDLIDHPIYRYKINIKGDSAIGFTVEAEQTKGSDFLK